MCPHSPKNANPAEPGNGAVHGATGKPWPVELLATGVSGLDDILGGGLAIPPS
jgi:hypothetical protein